MRRLLLAIAACMLAGCRSAEPVVIYITATPQPLIITKTATPRPPTPTARPTRTKTRTPTREPTWEPVAVGDVEAALRNAGYRRFPFGGSGSLAGFSWVDNNAYERVRTWESGIIELQVLHDKSSQVRSDHMEQHLTALDSALPAGFMANLREHNAKYNKSVGATVSGEPDHVYPLNDEWQTVWAEYSATEVYEGGYWIRFSLWWWQSTCPSEALYCYYEDFPGLEFEGDSSFVFYTITIVLPTKPGLPSTGA